MAFRFFSRPASPPADQDEDWSDLMRHRAGLVGERPPLGQLPIQGWLAWPETQAVIDALQADGQQVRFVGGCVRDALCGRAINDIDLATPDVPETVMALLDRVGIKAIPTGLKHGTISAVIPPHRFEITTLRKDVACDGRHADVVWTTDWREDAARRDFSINALSATPDGAVYDYFDGLQDLAHGRIRFIGRPGDRLEEDYLRILRYFRFYGRYGLGRPSRAALAACRLAAPHLSAISGERLRDECLKILMPTSAPEVWALMMGERVLDEILPEATNVGRLRQMVFLETRGLHQEGLAVDPLRRLAALLPSGMEAAEAVQAVAERLKLSRAESLRLVAMSQLQQLPALSADPLEHWRALRHAGGALTIDRLLLRWAEWRAQEGRVSSQVTEGYLTRLEQARTWEPQPFPLQGRDILALGVNPGQMVGKLLHGLEEWWEDQGGTPEKAAILAEAQRRLQSDVVQ